MSIILARRGFLLGLGSAALAAPAIVRALSLMKLPLPELKSWVKEVSVHWAPAPFERIVYVSYRIVRAPSAADAMLALDFETADKNNWRLI